MSRRLRILSAFLALSPVLTSAQTGSSDSSSSNLPQELNPVEVRAIRSSARAPFAKTEISGAELQKDNFGQDLPYLLQYTPSIQVSSDAGAGVGYTGMRIRGSDITRINVTLNGIAVNDAESGGAFFVDLPDLASSTNSLQIQRGVGGSTNGPGAFGGTLSVSNLQDDSVAGAAATIGFGSFNTQKYMVSANTGMLPGNVAFSARLSYIRSDGYIDRASSRLGSMQLNGLWRPSRNTSIRAMVLVGAEKTYQAWNGTPEEKLFGSDSALRSHYNNNIGVLYFTAADSANLFGSDRRYNYFTYSNQTDNYMQNYYQLFGEHRFSSKLSAQAGVFLTRGIGYYEEYKPEQKYSKYGLAPVTTPAGDTFSTTDLIRRLWLDNYNYGLVYSLLWNATPNTNVTFGGGWSQYLGEHYGDLLWAQNGGVPNDYRWYHLDAQKNDANVYLKAEHQINRLFLYGDLQVRTIGYFMNGFRDNRDLKPAVTYTFFNPKAGFSYNLRQSSRIQEKVYASIAVANKEPNRNDFEASDSTLPKPERLIDVEAGYDLRKSNWQLGINAYYMDYKDQLVLTGKVNDVGAYTRTNVARSYRSGLEIQGAFKLTQWLNIQANATLSSNKIHDFTEYVDDYDDGTQKVFHYGTTDIAFSPQFMAAGGLTLAPFRNAGKAWSLDILARYVSRQYLDNTGNVNRSIDPYAVCDMRIRYQPQMRGFRNLSVNLLLNNVLNSEYVSNGYTYSYILASAQTTQNFYYPQAGFNWLLGLAMKW